MLCRATVSSRLLQLERLMQKSVPSKFMRCSNSHILACSGNFSQRSMTTFRPLSVSSNRILSSQLLFASYTNKIQISAISASSKQPKHWRIQMDDEEKKKKIVEIEKMKQEKKPEGSFALLKYYVKRYWYIAIPVHAVSSIFWFVVAFAAVKSGVDVVSILEHLHMPDSLVEKIKNTPPSAGVAVVALILYKILTPLRYATTLAGIKLTFSTLRKMGKLKTAKEVTYKLRTEYEKRADKLKFRYRRYTKFGARGIGKKPLGGNGKKS